MSRVFLRCGTVPQRQMTSNRQLLTHRPSNRRFPRHPKKGTNVAQSGTNGHPKDEWAQSGTNGRNRKQGRRGAALPLILIALLVPPPRATLGATGAEPRAAGAEGSSFNSRLGAGQRPCDQEPAHHHSAPQARQPESRQAQSRQPRANAIAADRRRAERPGLAAVVCAIACDVGVFRLQHALLAVHDLGPLRIQRPLRGRWTERPRPLDHARVCRLAVWLRVALHRQRAVARQPFLAEAGRGLRGDRQRHVDGGFVGRVSLTGRAAPDAADRHVAVVWALLRPRSQRQPIPGRARGG